MRIAIGLPNHIAGVAGPLMAEWARRAERRGFESVTTIDRLVYPSLDSVVSLALAAGATTDLGLVTNILLAPLYPPAVLAKQLATLAAAAGERLVIGIAVGGREDDYAAAGADFGRRGRVLDAEAATLASVWRAEPVGDGDTPLTPSEVRIPLLFGGRSAATLRRATTVGDGWVAGALRDYPAQSEFLDRVRAGWRDAGREGSPLNHASVNFAFGDAAVVESGRAHLGRYYGFYPEFAALNVADMLTSPQDARDTVRAYADLGFDRVLFHPTVTDPDQVDRLADAVL
jgi:alkanesulfonate monooxygenase SsuD/methylene tetrahydromethanopterin reductase-like flavin-dependent oxidoreductase (luciferase family)